MVLVEQRLEAEEDTGALRDGGAAPGGEGGASGLDGAVHIGPSRVGDGAKRLGGGRVGDGQPPAGVTL